MENKSVSMQRIGVLDMFGEIMNVGNGLLRLYKINIVTNASLERVVK